jgi:8-oxo-dGTP pyrophosphatase MutT (NUDIX family)
MVLLYPFQDRWHIPLTLRPKHLQDHGGQISLPGGRLEAGETYATAASRELYEELGVPASDLEIIGRLSPTYVYASNYRVESTVAFVRTRPRFRTDPLEVEELIELPVRCLVDPAHFGRHEIRRGGLSFTAPHIACGSHRIWGATGVVLGELAGALNELGQV